MQSVEKGMSKMPQLIREHLRKMRNARKQAEEADANMKKLLDEVLLPDSLCWTNNILFFF